MGSLIRQITNVMVNLFIVGYCLGLLYASYLILIPSNFVFNERLVTTEVITNKLQLLYDNIKLRRCSPDVPIQRLLINVDTGDIFNISNTKVNNSLPTNRLGITNTGWSKNTKVSIDLPSEVPNGHYIYRASIHYVCNIFDDHTLQLTDLMFELRR